MSGTTNPLVISQGGPLNRLRCSITLGSFPNLNLVVSNMGKSFAKVTFGRSFTTQYETATGIINSPEPFVTTEFAVGILRTQPVATAWINQIQSTTFVGSVNIIPDTSNFPTISIDQAAITGFDISAYDGQDPTIALKISGRYIVNLALWNLA